MNDLISFIIYILIYVLSNLFVCKHLESLCKSYFIITSFFGAIISPIHCALILDKQPSLVILIIFLLFFQIITVCFLTSKLFNYKILTIIVFLVSCYFLIMCSSYFGEYYLRNDFILLSDTIESKIATIIDNENYSLRLKVLHLQKYYVCIGFKYFFELPENLYINFVFISQFIIGKLFDITIFANLGNYLINKYNDLKTYCR